LALSNNPATTGLRELIRAASEGDEAAWNAIVARFERLLWSTVRAYRLSQADGADVCQTTWLRLVESLDRIRDPERLGGWLVTTASRECLRVIRRGGRELPSDDAAPFDDSRVDPIVEAVLTDERERALLVAFSKLDERCRRLLRILGSAEPPSYEQIGAALGMPIGSIGPTRARCLAKLRARPELVGLEVS
jgi:RNA polymerase sigma factor (sigma-70 family)